MIGSRSHRSKIACFRACSRLISRRGLLRAARTLCWILGVTWNMATHWPTRLSRSPGRKPCWRTSRSSVKLNSPPAGQQVLEILRGLHAIHGRAKAGAQEVVFEMFADDGVVAAADAEDIHAAGDFGVGQQRAAGHGAIPVAVESAEREDGGEGVGVELLHLDAAEKRQRQPDERADAVPEIIAHREPAEKGFEPIVEPLGESSAPRARAGSGMRIGQIRRARRKRGRTVARQGSGPSGGAGGSRACGAGWDSGRNWFGRLRRRCCILYGHVRFNNQGSTPRRPTAASRPARAARCPHHKTNTPLPSTSRTVLESPAPG